jgi:uncharacterized membrane protein HdeD (DUF308 family)
MATAIQQGAIAGGLERISHKWGWFLALGILQVALGSIAVVLAVLTTIVSVLFFGWLLLIGGVMSAVSAFWEKAWSGFFLDLIVGLLYAVAGVMMIVNPVESAAALTLLIAMFLMFGGALRIGIALANKFEHRWWVLLNGAISLVLGIMILNRWPSSSLWVIGLFVGIEMIFYGWSLIMLSLVAKKLPGSATQATT